MYKSVILIAVPQVFGSHPLFFRKVLLQEGHPIVAAAMLSVEEALKIASRSVICMKKCQCNGCKILYKHYVEYCANTMQSTMQTPCASRILHRHCSNTVHVKNPIETLFKHCERKESCKDTTC
ncbi:hypothetical protein AAZX31_07G151500 [Glycine max]|uniref:Uncharacterized protein n=2 Tax=Glycine subgen. Soja TaxID=1462606 RepID=K7L235_SOYBN|nr:hypothetical protein JHK87_018677 [Glycine soja]KAG5022881.1 hypothetical protein JHK85_019223 [Glycine max]KAG5037958.1 hypothetical protein JHK86_018798 [Glycine max]KAG5143086.1 hypothetical protein JHK82_018781 [Glycine max]KRH49532.1 hypothetical protein GLYMA_07G162000v4 [Glycine max]